MTLSENNNINKFAAITNRFLDKLSEDISISHSTAFISRILMELVTLFLIFYLSVEAFGVYILALIITNIVQKFFDFQIGTAVNRYTSEFNVQKNFAALRDLIISALKINLILGFILSISIFSLSETIAIEFYHNPALILPLRVASLLLGSRVVFDIVSQAIRGLRLFKYGQISGISIRLIALTLIPCFVILFSMGATGAILGEVIGVIIGNLLGGIFFYHYIKKFWKTRKKTTFSKFSVNKLLSFSAPLYISGIMGIMFTFFDRLFLGIFSVGDVAILHIAFTISGVIDIPVMVLSTGKLFQPIFSELYSEGDFNTFKIVFRYLVKYNFLLMLPFSLFLLFFTEPILLVIFPHYLAALLAIQIISLKVPLRALQRAECLISMKRPINHAIFSLLLGLTSITLNILLIPVIGIVGGAIAYIIAMTVGTVYIVLILRRHTLFMTPGMQTILKTVIIAFFSLSISYFLLQFFPLTVFSLFMVFLIDLFIYLMLIYKLVLSSLERRVILNIIRSLFGISRKEVI